MSVGVVTLYWAVDPGSPPVNGAARDLWETGVWGSVSHCLRKPVRAVIVTEPLWIRVWLRNLMLIVLVKCGRSIMRRPPVTFGCYAIENLAPRERLTLPLFDGWPEINRALSSVLGWAVRLSARHALDRVAFGTSAAQDNYVRHRYFGDGVGQRLVPERLGSCAVCAPADAARDRRVLFLAEFAHRKGVDLLLDAWGDSVLRRNGWSLTLCGSGPLETLVEQRTAADPTVRLVRRPPRATVHELLRTSAAVVLPSRRVPRWREQAGLSVLEGEAHGCRIIVSEESGMAAELARRAQARVVRADSRADLRDALDELAVRDDETPPATTAECVEDSMVAVMRFLRGR